MKTLFCSALCFCLTLGISTCLAVSPPFTETFESYAVGNTAVTGFIESGSLDWTIVSPGLAASSRAYEDAISATSSGVGISAGANSSSGLESTALQTSSFGMSTLFRIDTFTLTGSDSSNTATIGLYARSSSTIPASTGADRYQVSYFLDDDGSGHPTGRLYLTEINSSFGDSLNALSASSLPVTLGDLYQLSLTGTNSGGSLALTAILTDLTTSSSISVSKTDSSNLLTRESFGYFNAVRAKDGGTATLNADFDNFSLTPEPATSLLLLFGFGIQFALCRSVRNR